MPAKATEAPPLPPTVDDEVVSDDSLAPNDENDEQHNDFPPPPEEATVVATAEEAVVRQEPPPEKATIERSRSPSPVKMAETSSNAPARPPSYDEVVSDEIEPPPAYEYTVKAVYPYKQADEDELSFAKGEMILVVKHPHPEEQVQFFRTPSNFVLTQIFLLGRRMASRNQRRGVETHARFEKALGLVPSQFHQKTAIALKPL